MGMPGLSGFIGEFPIIQGVWRGPMIDPTTLKLAYMPTFNYYAIIAIVSAIGIIVTAAYVLRVVQQVFFGEFNEQRFPGIKDVTPGDKLPLTFLPPPLVFLPSFPRIYTRLVPS